MSYSLVLWVKIWQIFSPMRLELLKTHHCALATHASAEVLELVFKQEWRSHECLKTILFWHTRWCTHGQRLCTLISRIIGHTVQQDFKRYKKFKKKKQFDQKNVFSKSFLDLVRFLSRLMGKTCPWASWCHVILDLVSFLVPPGVTWHQEDHGKVFPVIRSHW